MPVARLPRPLQLQGQRPAEAASAQLSGGERGRLHLAKTLLAGRQRAAARRAVERPRRRDAARAGRRAARVRRQRAGDLATTAGSSTASPPTSWPPRATRKWMFFDGNYQEYEADKKQAPRRGRRAAAPAALQGAEVGFRAPARSVTHAARIGASASRAWPPALPHNSLPARQELRSATVAAIQSGSLWCLAMRMILVQVLRFAAAGLVAC